LIKAYCATAVIGRNTIIAAIKRQQRIIFILFVSNTEI
jgi:hypothetical protein